MAASFVSSLAILITAAIFSASAQEQSGPGGPGGPRPPKENQSGKGSGNEARKPGAPRGFGQSERKDPFSQLSEEEKKRVRAVLTKVWQDPAVMAAKEGVRVSTEEYREALKKAVTRLDPEAAGLMNKVHEGSESADMRKRFEENMGGMRPGGPRGPGGPGKRPGGGGFMSDLPEFVRALTEEQRAIYLEAREQAESSEKIAELRKQVGALEKKERASREERYEMMMRMRRAMREEMIRIDPRVEKITPDFSRGPKDGGGSKGGR